MGSVNGRSVTEVQNELVGAAHKLDDALADVIHLREKEVARVLLMEVNDLVVGACEDERIERRRDSLLRHVNATLAEVVILLLPDEHPVRAAWLKTTMAGRQALKEHLAAKQDVHIKALKSSMPNKGPSGERRDLHIERLRFIKDAILEMAW